MMGSLHGNRRRAKDFETMAVFIIEPSLKKLNHFASHIY
jgi:hypothetical protein